MIHQAFSKIWIMVILVALIGSGVLMNKYYFDTQTDDKIADWKTYKSEEYGFEFKYPKSWHIYKNYDIIAISTYPEDTLEIPSAYGLITINHRINITLDKLLETYKGLTEHPESSNIFPGSKEFLFEDITMDDIKIHKITAIPKENIDEKGIVYFIPDKNNQNFFQFIGTFKGNKKEKYAQNFEQMLSTFKFIENENETADWETYTNGEYGFKLKYPKNWVIVEDNLKKNVTKHHGPIVHNMGNPNDWWLFFDTNIDKENRDIIIHLFIENLLIYKDLCEQKNICHYDKKNPIFSNEIRIYEWTGSSTFDWVIEYNDKFIGISKIFDLEEGRDYVDRIGIDLRQNLDGDILEMLKTMEPDLHF